MSILIKGMKMPTEGEYNLTLYVCSDGSAYMDVASFPVDKDKFEAIPVSEHGRLIDADALREEFDKLIVHDSWCYYALDYAPTIIEAEEGE